MLTNKKKYDIIYIVRNKLKNKLINKGEMKIMGLLDIKPHQVSRDMKGYSCLLYGEPKSGKTTTATRFPNHLLLAFEKGYNAIPGAMAMPINSWGDFKKALRELKTQAVKDTYETIIIDTADIAYDYCEKYILNLQGVEKIGDIPYGAGYGMVKKEFDECLRLITQLNYGLVLISHSKDKVFKDEKTGAEYNKIVPTLAASPSLICTRLCDIIGYSRAVQTEDGLQTRLFMRGTSFFEAGSRFKYTPDSIVFSYENLVSAIGEAIDKQAAEVGGQYFTETPIDHSVQQASQSDTLDFNTINESIQDVIATLMLRDSLAFQPRIQQAIEKHLGKGRKLTDCTLDHVEMLELVLLDLNDMV